VTRFLLLDQSAQLDRLVAAVADAGKGILLTFMLPEEAQRVVTAGFRLPSGDPRVPVRNAAVKGPLPPDGEWVMEKAGADAGRIAIVRLPNGEDITYEVANLIDGIRPVGEIRDAVSAEFGPIELRTVAEYIDVLVRAGAVTFRK
jgi:hypothetical protein